MSKNDNVKIVEISDTKLLSSSEAEAAPLGHENVPQPPDTHGTCQQDKQSQVNEQIRDDRDITDKGDEINDGAIEDTECARTDKHQVEYFNIER